MGHKKLVSIKPTRIVKDAKGHTIEIKRGGSVDKNKYARLTPQEKEFKANIGNSNYVPGKGKTK